MLPSFGGNGELARELGSSSGLASVTAKGPFSFKDLRLTKRKWHWPSLGSRGHVVADSQ